MFLSIGFALVLVALALSPLTAKWLCGDVREALRGRSWALWMVFLSVAVGLALRLWLPHRPVMYFMGYHFADLAWHLDEVPKYGPGSLVLYHLWFQLAGPSHQAMMWLNAVLGGLTPVAAAAVTARMGASALVTALSAILVALVPLFVKDGTSESLLVPMTLWLLCGSALFLRYRETGRIVHLASALALVLLAAWSRPEATLLAPLTILLLTLKRWGPRPCFSRGRGLIWAAAMGLLVLRLWHLHTVMVGEVAMGNNPNLAAGWPHLLLVMGHGLLVRNAAFWPSLFPAAVTILALAGLLPGPWSRRWPGMLLLLAGAAWLFVSSLDLPYVSVARVQAPGLIFVTLAAAWGAGNLREYLWDLSPPPVVKAVAWIGVVGLLAGTMMMTVPALWQRTNPDEEEELLVEVMDALPAGPVLLVRRSYLDEPLEKVHLDFPDYLLEPPHREGRVAGLREYLDGRPFDGPAYFLLGVRCYMRECGRMGLHPACREMLELDGVETVIQRDVPVHRFPTPRVQWETRPDQDLDFPWCLAVESNMRLGLYRLSANE